MLTDDHEKIAMTDEWKAIGEALRTPRKICTACGGRGYTYLAYDVCDVDERDCLTCCGTGHEIEENDL